MPHAVSFMWGSVPIMLHIHVLQHSCAWLFPVLVVGMGEQRTLSYTYSFITHTHAQCITTHSHSHSCTLIVFGGLRWEIIALMTASVVPGVVFSLHFVLNLFLWGAGSSAAIPYTTLLALLCLWLGISIPLTLLGSFLGFRKAVSNLLKSITLCIVIIICV